MPAKNKLRGVLVLPPFYYKNVNDEGIINFYRKIIESVGENSFHYLLYNIPQTTSIELNFNIIESLLKLGVETKVHYPIPLHLQKCSANLGYKNGDIPNVERLAKSMISLPIYHTLNNDEIDYVIESVNSVIKNLIK